MLRTINIAYHQDAVHGAGQHSPAGRQHRLDLLDDIAADTQTEDELNLRAMAAGALTRLAKATFSDDSNCISFLIEFLEVSDFVLQVYDEPIGSCPPRQLVDKTAFKHFI